MDPNVAARTTDDKRARDFHLQPGARTMNMADTTLYRDRVFFRTYPDTSTMASTKWYWRRPNGFKSNVYLKLNNAALANDSDLASKPRLYGEGMERGAYECRAVLQRVIYVNPSIPKATAGDGSSWSEPFGQGQLQDAIDAAAIYTYLKRDVDEETRKAYVFVKASEGSASDKPLVARDGVLVFGGIPSGFNNEAYVYEGSTEYVNDECRRFSNYIRAAAAGVASPNATHTRISSVQIGGEDFRTGFVLDGFVFTNPDSTGTHAMTNSPLVLDNTKSLVRNCMFENNKMSGDIPVADVRKGLLYNALFFNDSANTVVKVGAGGLVLNNTIVAMREGNVAIDTTAATTGAVQNTIALWGDTAKCFADYLSNSSPYDLPTFYTGDGVLMYQLHERSAFINTGKDTADLPDIFDIHKQAKGIDFTRDRDILGNPRKICDHVDVGAFETWYVKPDSVITLTAETDKYIIRGDAQVATPEQRRTAFIRHYGGNYYPHRGSVVYVMDSAVLSIDTAALAFDDFEAQPIPLRPGYLLLKSGASLYGNGHMVQVPYLGVEKRFINQRYSMTAFPFNYKTDNITMTQYNSTTGELTHDSARVNFNTYLYNGEARSAKDYNFQTDNSTLWQRVDTLNRTATQGYLMDFGKTISDTTLRFNAYSTVFGQYVYTEDEYEWEKIVYLTKYDHRDPGTGAELNFTRQEDMGWNMKGLPWLVSNYRTDTIVDSAYYQRQMFIPHVLYQMDGAGEYIKLDGDKIYSARSWDRGTNVSMGNAFFTQTATTKDAEPLYFQLPIFDRNPRISRPLLAIRGGRGKDRTTDILTIMPDSAVSKNVNYTFGRDAIKWLSADNTVQMYLLDSKRLSRISLLGAAPTEVDIPLGISVPTEMDYTFSLPEKEAFSDYAYVWLIDNHLRHYTNLLNEDYTVSLEPGESNNRFAVRIGGYPKTDKNGNRQYVVFTHDGVLYVRGLVAGDRITVYAPSGQLVTHATATTAEWSMPLFYQSGYVVKVNDRAYKVVNL